MSKTITITDQAAPEIARLRGVISEGRLGDAMGQGAANRIRAHLVELNGTRANKLGGRRTNFYTQAAKSTNLTSVDLSPPGFTVTVSKQGFRQRYEGGRIRAVNAKLLTIPATAEAHGRRASEFPDLQLVVLGGRPALVRARQTRLRRVGGRRPGFRAASSTSGLEVLFWLKKEVNQRPDPSVLPTDAQIIAAAVAAGESALAAAKVRGGRRA